MRRPVHHTRTAHVSTLLFLKRSRNRSEREEKGPRRKVQDVTPHQRSDTDLPRNGWEARAIFIDEVAPCIEDPAVMKGQQSMPCGGRIVLPVLTVCILEWGKLIFS